MIDEENPRKNDDRFRERLTIRIIKDAQVRLNHSINNGIEDIDTLASEPIDIDIIRMYIEDFLDTIKIARAVAKGRSKRQIYNMLWNMDTAARDQVSPSLWKWIEEVEI